MEAFAISCRTSRKQTHGEPSAGTLRKKQREEPASGTRPIITMVLHQGISTHPVKVLLDTGCSIPLINQEMAARLRIPLRKHRERRIIENYDGKTVQGAGSSNTNALPLQHHRHYSQERFKVFTMEAVIDIFLPYYWIKAHPPQGQWDSPQLRFNGPECLQKCTKYGQTNFSLTWDDTVAVNPEAKIIGYVAMVQTENKTEDPRDNVVDEFQEYLDVMSKETADALPEHKSYDCQIELKEREKAPWGPI